MAQPVDDIAPPAVANTAAVIVTYLPDDEFKRRLAEISRQFAAVFWVDNTPPESARELADAGPNVQYIGSGRNAGLAAALNHGCRAAMEKGLPWVVTFDQDSLIEADFVVRQVEAWQRANNRPFILGCNYTDSTDTEFPRFPRGAYVRECRTVITSGSLMCLPQWRALGAFREDLFIDGVDHEICLRARANGLSVARHGELLMRHQIGERSRSGGLLPYRQPAGRMYYSTRNGARNVIEFASSEPVWAALRSAAIAWEGLVAILAGPRRIAKLKAIVRGLADGVRGNMGPASGEY